MIKLKKTKNQNMKFIGISFILLGFFCASCLNAFSKVLSSHVSLGLLLFMQNFFALCLYAPFARNIRLQTKKMQWHFFRASTGLLSYLCVFFAIKHISLLNATLLGNSAPLFLPFIALIWFGQRLSLSLWISLIIGFSGVFFIINPTQDIGALFKSWFVLIALLGSVFSAIALETVKYLNKTEEVAKINLYYFGLASILTLPWVWMDWASMADMNWPVAIATGFSLALTQFFLATAYKYGTPEELGPFNYSVVIFIALLGWIFWNQKPGLMDVIGVLLIVLGGILSIKNFKKAKN